MFNFLKAKTKQLSYIFPTSYVGKFKSYVNYEGYTVSVDQKYYCKYWNRLTLRFVIPELTEWCDENNCTYGYKHICWNVWGNKLSISSNKWDDCNRPYIFIRTNDTEISMLAALTWS